MYGMMTGFALGGTLLAALFAWRAGSKAARLHYVGDSERLRRRIRGLAVWAALAALSACLALYATGWMIASLPSLFWEDRLLIHVPLIAVPLLAVWFYSFPSLQRIVREVLQAGGAPDAAARGRLAAPGIVLPFQAAAVGSATAFYFDLAVSYPFGPMDAAAPLVVCLLVLAGLWKLHDSRSRAAATAESLSAPTAGQRILRVAGTLCVAAGLIAAVVIFGSQASKLPDRLDMASGPMEFGGGPELSHETAQTASVAMLTGPRKETPDRTISLTAEKATVRLASGKSVDAWTFNGQIPGPELRFRQGELVEVKLTNRDIDEGVTLHWHGLDVPNAEDGVAGATQDAVMPGQTHTYRFRAEQVGSFWYHSHQHSAEAVSKGLFGSLVVEPKDGLPENAKDFTVLTHLWDEGGFAIGADDGIRRETVAPGTNVRLRLINTDNWVRQSYVLAGAPFRVAAIDGTELNEPDELTGAELVLTTGGRYDVTFTMPDSPVFLRVGRGTELGLLMTPDGSGEVPPLPSRTEEFDPTHYGKPVSLPFSADSEFDREFRLVIDNGLGFFDGRMEMLYTINGKVFPDTPMFMVREGELIKTTIVNRGNVDHPMHLHGHHMLVLSRNGEAADGSPWWSDTLDVQPGEIYEVAFRADNPGLWMDHCHNLTHAAIGMSMHLMYEGVTTPYSVGPETGNRPE